VLMTIRACPSHGHRVAPRQGRSRFHAAAVASHALQQLFPGSLEPSRAGRASRVASGAQRRGSRPRHSVRACMEPALSAMQRLSEMKRGRYGQGRSKKIEERIWKGGTGDRAPLRAPFAMAREPCRYGAGCCRTYNTRGGWAHCVRFGALPPFCLPFLPPVVQPHADPQPCML
jgi:hypothetical protein